MIYNGDRVSDDRGSVTSVNDFNFKGVKRFYIVKNNKPNFFRGWHGHKEEGKYVFVVTGEAKIGWQSIELIKGMDFGGRITLSAKNPQVVYIPPGYANAAMNLTEDTEIMYFSTATLEESKADDYRFPEDRWPL